MNIKKLFCVLFISVMLLSVPCAYALDSDTVNVNEVQDDVKLSSSENEIEQVDNPMDKKVDPNKDSVNSPSSSVKLNEFAKGALASIDSVRCMFSCTHKDDNDYYEILTNQISSVEWKINTLANIIENNRNRKNCKNMDRWNSASKKINNAKKNLEDAKSYQRMLINKSDKEDGVNMENKRAFHMGLSCVKEAKTNFNSAKYIMKNM